MIPGTRPSGVMTAGEAQYLVNRKNLLPGDKVVVLGSGDIGLIMARRLTLEGAEVRLVLGQEATGLLRNHVRCIDDFGIPIRYGWGVVSVHGAGRLSGVTVAPLADDGSFDLACKEYVRCNLLLLACGLIPEREVLGSTWEAGLGTDAAGLFVCGNADVPHDLVDKVTQEGLRAGLAAARHVLGDAARSDTRIDELLGVLVREPKGRLSELRESGSAGRPIACTVCPTGCIIFAGDDGSLSGYSCNRGRDFAQSEIERPMRLFTGTVKSRSGELVPVRTSAEVEREKLLDVARACRRVRVGDDVHMGDVVARDVADTGVDLLACSGAHVGGCEGEGD